MKKTSFEWTFEVEDEAGDITDSSFSEKLSEASELTISEATSFGVVRSQWDDDNGDLLTRHWAYVKDGQLPEYFQDELGEDSGHKVPNRFTKELQEFNKQKSQGIKTYYKGAFKYFYDWSVQSWIVVKIDSAGNQTEPAEYYANRSQLLANHPEFDFKP